MAINLKKGQGISLKKSENDLSQITIGLGWDVAEEYVSVKKIVEKKKSGLAGLLGGKEAVEVEGQVQVEYDLDAIALLLDENDKIVDLGDLGENGGPTLINSDVVFYNSMKHKSGAIWLTGDNRTGEGDGDDEQIIVNLNQLPDKYKKVLFIVQIYNAIELNQNFSKVNNAFIRAVDKKGKEMCRFDLSGDPTYADCRSLIFAELKRNGPEWTFNAIGKTYPSDSFIPIMKEYIK